MKTATISYSQGNGFLDIAKLEDLKEKQKPIEGKQTRRKFYSIILLTEGEIKETIGRVLIIFYRERCIL